MLLKLYERCGQILIDLQKLIERQDEAQKITEIRYVDAELDTQNRADFDSSNWALWSDDGVWGQQKQTVTWFDFQFEVPEAWKKRTVTVTFDTNMGTGWEATNPQFTVYVDGKIRQALDTNHRYVTLLPEDLKGVHRMSLRAYSGEDDGRRLTMRVALTPRESEIEAFYWDMSVPYRTLELLNPDSKEYLESIHAINDAVNCLDLRKPYSEAFFEGLRAASKQLKEGYYDQYCDASKLPVVKAVGHTHIDVAWLWPLLTTRDKAVRSFSTVIQLMREYDDYIFMSSQPQLYQYVLEQAPELFEEIKKRVAEGRWEVEGGMWLEADCNLTSGEGLVRQFLYGLRFFREHFNKENKILWLPDVFGYSAALPQIIKKSGMDYFMTTKIAWNDTNRMPCDTFEWQGIDGSRVLTHFSPSREYSRLGELFPTEVGTFTTYNAMLNETQVKGAWQRYGNKELNNSVLMSYGWGDGGGGTTPEMIERGRRMKKGINGLPRVEFSTARRFFDELAEEVKGKKTLPVWDGELYFEYHRATLTSMARNKRWNRKAEFALANLESLCVMAERFCKIPYPHEEIRLLWRVVLRNQFHDILPGSSIGQVYDDSKREYLQLFADIDRMKAKIFDAMGQAQAGQSCGEFLLFHYNDSHSVHEVNLGEGQGVLDAKRSYEAVALVPHDGLEAKRYPIQRTYQGQWICLIDELPSKGFMRFKVEEVGEVEPFTPQNIQLPYTLENDYLHIDFDAKGRFDSLYDQKEGRELILKGRKGNRIVSHQTKPHAFDAWDLNAYYKEKFWEVDELESATLIEDGPIRTALKLRYLYQESLLEQTVYLYHNEARVDLVHDVDWKEHQQMLKLYFPVDIHSNEATYEIQYGHVTRKTHYNTSWDRARFEVCCHKWLDFSEYGYGLAVLNDSKFGVGIHEQEIGLTMLKAGVDPYPDADIEMHHFVYSLRPHTGDYREKHIIDAAYDLNNPSEVLWLAKDATVVPNYLSLAESQTENVVVEVVKAHEDLDADIIRVYEAHGRRARASLSLSGDYTSFEEVDLTERPLSQEEKEQTQLEGGEGLYHFDIKPFEIKTFMAKRR